MVGRRRGGYTGRDNTFYLEVKESKNNDPINS